MEFLITGHADKGTCSMTGKSEIETVSITAPEMGIESPTELSFQKLIELVRFRAKAEAASNGKGKAPAPVLAMVTGGDNGCGRSLGTE
jgi:hypothetical protein